MLNFEVEILSLRQLEYEMDCTVYPVDYNFFEIGYCGQPYLPYVNIQFKQATNGKLSHFQEEDHPFIHDTPKNKKKQFVSLYFVYRPKKNASITDITDDDKQDYTFAPTYGYESTGYHRNMISIVVFFYSNTLKSMLVNYAVTEMVWFDEYLDADPRAKNMGGNGITTFLLHVAQCISFCQTKFVTETLISEAYCKSVYPILGFKVIKDSATSPHFEKACKWFQ